MVSLSKVIYKKYAKESWESFDEGSFMNLILIFETNRIWILIKYEYLVVSYYFETYLLLLLKSNQIFI